MRWIKYIWIPIVIYLTCSARTCTEDQESIAKSEAIYTKNLKENVKQVFTSDSLPEHFLRAYEVSATEKLNDFADYIKIISDTSLDRRFRMHSAELVKKMFVSDEINLSGWCKTYPKSLVVNLEELLAYGLREGMSGWIKPVQMNFSEPFVMKNDSTFTGNLTFNCKYLPWKSTDTSEISDKISVNIYLVRKLKSFGTDQYKVWDVYLGDIN
jgi:hypothetical protein